MEIVTNNIIHIFDNWTVKWPISILLLKFILLLYG